MSLFLFIPGAAAVRLPGQPGPTQAPWRDSLCRPGWPLPQVLGLRACSTMPGPACSVKGGPGVSSLIFSQPRPSTVRFPRVCVFGAPKALISTGSPLPHSCPTQGIGLLLDRQLTAARFDPMPRAALTGRASLTPDVVLRATQLETMTGGLGHTSSRCYSTGIPPALLQPREMACFLGPCTSPIASPQGQVEVILIGAVHWKLGS